MSKPSISSIRCSMIGGSQADGEFPCSAQMANGLSCRPVRSCRPYCIVALRSQRARWFPRPAVGSRQGAVNDEQRIAGWTEGCIAPEIGLAHSGAGRGGDGEERRWARRGRERHHAGGNSTERVWARGSLLVLYMMYKRHRARRKGPANTKKQQAYNLIIPRGADSAELRARSGEQHNVPGGTGGLDRYCTPFRCRLGRPPPLPLPLHRTAPHRTASHRIVPRLGPPPALAPPQ